MDSAPETTTACVFGFVFMILFLAIETAAASDVYTVLLNNAAPVVHYDGSMGDFPAPTYRADGRADMTSEAAQRYASFLVQQHNSVLERTLEKGTYTKLYSYHYLVNGFAAWLAPEQAEELLRLPEVVMVEKDRRVKKLTTYTPSYMGLPNGAWAENGGMEYAGEGIVIGIVDTGVDPTHPSFSDLSTNRSYRYPSSFKGECEVAKGFPAGSCNNKLVGARHFAAAAIASGQFNASIDFASPLDGDGHGTHTAATAAGNSRIPVQVAGMDFGLASGMAPRAHLAIYKSLYRSFGGYFADTVAAMDQAVQDGVDILSLSIGPDGPPSGLGTFFGAFEVAALSAIKAGVFVAQAAGNSGPFPGTIASFSPWVFTVAAAYHDRSYKNSILLGNQELLDGLGLSPGTKGLDMYILVLASDALKRGRANRSGDRAHSCQDSSIFNKSLVEGRILICFYTFSFSIGLASIHSLLETAKNLSAKGVVILVHRDTSGENISPFPSTLPAIIIPRSNHSEAFLGYYNSCAQFTASARILGGLNATFSDRPPQVAVYSSRGPDISDDKLDIAEIMKPDAMAPGNMIWAAWPAIGIDVDEFRGETFALISGTSMSTPHVAGIAALVKQKNPKLSPAAIKSALTTTASSADSEGNHLLAQRPYYDVTLELGPGTPFDFGAGEVNATAALDPGLVFDAGFRNYVYFLCSIPASAPEVLNATGATCGSAFTPPTDLNTPSITIANLTATRLLPRTVTNIAPAAERFTVMITEPEGVSISVIPSEFNLRPEKTQRLVIKLTPTSTSLDPCFGSLTWTGSNGHRVRIPVSVISRMKSGSTG